MTLQKKRRRQVKRALQVLGFIDADWKTAQEIACRTKPKLSRMEVVAQCTLLRRQGKVEKKKIGMQGFSRIVVYRRI